MVQLSSALLDLEGHTIAYALPLFFTIQMKPTAIGDVISSYLLLPEALLNRELHRHLSSDHCV